MVTGLPRITMEELARHCKPGDYFIALYGQVIDISNFISKHPGGEKILEANAGMDVTQKFEAIHASSGRGSCVLHTCWPVGRRLAVTRFPTPAGRSKSWLLLQCNSTV